MHKFRTGPWAKKVQTPADHFKFLLHATSPQLAFVHELSSQQLGHAPSRLWGVPIPHELHPQADQDTLHFVRSASRQPAHEFGRLIASHKKASGFISTLGELVGDGARTVGKYGKNVARFVSKNGEAIQRGVAITKDLVSTGATIAKISGMIHPDTASSIDAIAEAVNKHVQGKHYKKGGQVRWRKPLVRGRSRLLV